MYDYGFRIYNPEIAKFLSVDPLFRGYPELSVYQYASNNPILNIDVDGLEGLRYGKTKSPNLLEAVSEGYTLYPLMQTANGLGNFYRKVEANIKGTDKYTRTDIVINKTEFGSELYQEDTDTPTSNGWEGVKQTGSDALDMTNITGSSNATGLFARVTVKGQLAKDLIIAADNAVAGLKSAMKAKQAQPAKRDRVYKLYMLLDDKTDELLKWGHTTMKKITDRYSNAFLEGKRMEEVASGTAEEILKKERELVKSNPGPLNNESYIPKKP